MDICGQLETNNIWYAAMLGSKDNAAQLPQLLAFNPSFKVFGGLKAPGATHGSFQPSRTPERGGSTPASPLQRVMHITTKLSIFPILGLAEVFTTSKLSTVFSFWTCGNFHNTQTIQFPHIFGLAGVFTTYTHIFKVYIYIYMENCEAF